MKKLIRTHKATRGKRRRLYIPDEFMEKLGWDEDTQLSGEIDENGDIFLKKKDPRFFTGHLNIQPKYNVVSIPVLPEKIANQVIQIEAIEEALIVRFL